MVKISLNTVTRECIADSNFLGFEGENQANVLDFSFSGEHIDGTAVLNIKRGKDTGFVAVDKVGNGYQLPVRSSLLSQVGDITFQFVITTPSGAIMKFDSFVMTVEDAIDTDAPLPEEYPSWVEMANYKLAEVDAAITRANSTSNQLLQDKENGVFDGKDGVDGRNGINGISPTVTTEETATGTKITITDINGTHVAEILNGEKGATGATGPIGPRGLTGPQGPQGPAGKDGAVSFEELTEEQKVTLKGDKGDKGDTGPQGEQGPKGPAGETGPQGPEGPQGPKGDKGDAGETGATGETGPEGPQGETGPAGKDGLTPYIGDNGNWWIGDTDTGVKASGSGSGGSSYREQELLSTPADYTQGGSGGTTLNLDLDLLDDVTKYDELVFSSCVKYSNGSTIDLYTQEQQRILTSSIVFNNSNTPLSKGEYYGLTLHTSGVRHLTFWFKTSNKILIRTTSTSGSTSGMMFRIMSIKGIKY